MSGYIPFDLNPNVFSGSLEIPAGRKWFTLMFRQGSYIPLSREGFAGLPETWKAWQEDSDDRCETCGDVATHWDYDQYMYFCARHIQQRSFTFHLSAPELARR